VEDCLVRTVDLTKRFVRRFGKTSITAVDHVSVEIKRGEIFGVLGQNGAGKSTLLKMICGLLRPSEGEVIINGKAVEKYRRETLSEIGAVLEGSRNSLWSMTVRQNITYFGYLKNVHGFGLKQRGERLLRLFQLEDKQDELVKNLSKGMKQKLAIALAFINDPSLVLLDEPTLGLDVQTERIVKELIVGLSKEKNKTVLLSSHDMRLVEEICDRVAIISKGRVVRLDETKSLLRNIDQEVYLIRLEGTPELQRVAGIGEVRIIKVQERSQKEGECLLRVTMGHHERLFEVIDALRAEDLRVLSITKCEPSLEDVFVKVVES